MRVELRGVRKDYRLPLGGGSLAALDGINLIIESGSLSVVRGESGSGKSTLLAVLAGLAVPTSGRVQVAGTDPFKKRVLHRGEISLAFQEPLFVPELTVLENLLLPAVCCGKEDAGIRGERLLEVFGLDEKFDLFPGSLSGGERRRLNLARSIIAAPRLLLLDEPTAYLDTDWAERSMEILAGSAEEYGTTVVVATHLPVPRTEGARIITLVKGRVTGDSVVDS